MPIVSVLVALYSPVSGATYLPEAQIWLGCLHHRDHQVLPPGARGVRTCGSHLLVISYTPDLKSGPDEPHYLILCNNVWGIGTFRGEQRMYMTAETP